MRSRAVHVWYLIPHGLTKEYSYRLIKKKAVLQLGSLHCNCMDKVQKHVNIQKFHSRPVFRPVN